MENSFQKGGKWKRGGQQQQCGRVKVKREEQLLFPLTSWLSFSLKYPFFEHIDSVTLFSCLNSLLERIKFNPSLFLGSVLFCIPLRPEENGKDKWYGNHRPHKKQNQIGVKQPGRGVWFSGTDNVVVKFLHMQFKTSFWALQWWVMMIKMHFFGIWNWLICFNYCF